MKSWLVEQIQGIARHSPILVTGANGFIGRHLCNTLSNLNVRVTQLVRQNYLQSTVAHHQIEVELLCYEAVKKIVNSIQPRYVIHLAGVKNIDYISGEWSEETDVNVKISNNLINACRELDNFQRFIFLGSCDEYGDAKVPYSEIHMERPVSPYGIAKQSTTKRLIKLFDADNFPCLILRPSVVYGPLQSGGMLIPSLIRSLLNDQFFPMTAGLQMRDFVYVDDVVSAILHSFTSENNLNGRKVNIGSGNTIKVIEVARLIANLIDPKTLKQIRFGEIAYRKNEVMNYSVDITLAKSLLNWAPSITIESGLAETIKQYKLNLVA
ncbi:MAG: NAD(P)-dependent oxidoreductase [Gammaproteobacteria bacterium]